MSNKKTIVKKETVPGIKVTISNNQQNITSEPVELENDSMVIIMPKTNPMVFKKKLYWFANILYKYWR